mgnify:CR=1 FL=1
MLIVKRKNGEGIRLTLPSGEHIEIFIDKMCAKSVSVQATAPISVSIERIDCNGNSQVRKNERYNQPN